MREVLQYMVRGESGRGEIYIGSLRRRKNLRIPLLLCFPARLTLDREPPPKNVKCPQVRSGVKTVSTNLGVVSGTGVEDKGNNESVPAQHRRYRKG